MTNDAHHQRITCVALIAVTAGNGACEPSRFRQAVLTLSEHECEVLDTIARGQRNKHVARRFGISPGTVETHRENALRKLRVRNTAELIRIYSLVSNARSKTWPIRKCCNGKRADATVSANTIWRRSRSDGAFAVAVHHAKKAPAISRGKEKPPVAALVRDQADLREGRRNP